MTRIEPTVGRVMHYRPAAHEGARMIHNGDQPLTAHVAKVNDDGTLNLAVLGVDGIWHARSSVPVVQAGEEAPVDQSYVEWMPYQVGQAAKTEAAEAETAALKGAAAEEEAGDVGAATEPVDNESEGQRRSSRKNK